MIFPVVWKASSTIASSWSDAAKWNTLKIFFQPDLMLWAWEFTIWAMQRTTISRIVGDLDTLNNQSCIYLNKNEKGYSTGVNITSKHSPNFTHTTGLFVYLFFIFHHSSMLLQPSISFTTSNIQTLTRNNCHGNIKPETYTISCPEYYDD